MDIRRTVTDFVSQGQGLCRQLRAQGVSLSDVELVSLREQLHILDAEAGHIQDLKQFQSESSPFLFSGKHQGDTKHRSRPHH